MTIATPVARRATRQVSIGNVGKGSKRDTQFAEMIEFACRHDKPVRIGVNWGSLDQDLLARMMDNNATRTYGAGRNRSVAPATTVGAATPAAAGAALSAIPVRVA